MSVIDDSLFQSDEHIQSAARLSALQVYDALDSFPTDALDELSRLAAHLCQVPAAMITLVGSDCQRFISRVGLEHTTADLPEALLSKGFDREVVKQGQPVMIHQASAAQSCAPQSCTHSLAVAEDSIQFYAGVPLRTPEGHVIGTLCVLDTVPHELTDLQLQSLETIARQVVSQLELRLSAHHLKQTTHALIGVSHGVAAAVGDTFFSALVQHFTEALGLDYAYVALLQSDARDAEDGSNQLRHQRETHLKTLVVCHRGQLIENFTYRLEGTPCADVLTQNDFCYYEQDVQKYYPDVPLLPSLEIESYAAVPIVDVAGETFGVLAVMDTKPLKAVNVVKAVLTVFSVRIATELERLRSEERKTQLLEREHEARKQAETANQMKDDFLSVVSHELRSPLNPILGWTQLLRRGTVSTEKTDKALEVIERNVRRQVNLIDDLLDVSRILRDNLTLKTAPVHMDKIVAAALLAVQSSIEQKSIRLEYQNTTDRAVVMGDADRLVQLVENLLSNAVKFTPEGGTIDISLAIQDDDVHLEVTDSGIGISPEFLPSVFDHFRQANYSTIRRFGGLGLGLAIVYHLTKMHNGTITASSPGEGRGATFKLKVPMLTAKR